MKPIHIKSIADFCCEEDDQLQIIHPENFIPIHFVASIEDATEDSIVFIASGAKNQDVLIENTPAKTIICNSVANPNIGQNKCLLVVRNPKLFFTRTINRLLNKDILYGIHPSVIISPEAHVHPDTYIGPNVIIGKNVTIDKGCIIHGNVHIYDNTRIGKNVIIDSGVVIGAAGFGFVRDESGVPIRFPQLGQVIIEDQVEIGANTCIDRGALSNTIIRKNVKIDNLVQIAHNVEIGENTYIIGHTSIAGSVKIGKNCWIGTSSIIQKVTIGDNVTIGIGAVVLKSVKSGQTYIGYPAVEVETFARNQYKFKKL